MGSGGFNSLWSANINLPERKKPKHLITLGVSHNKSLAGYQCRREHHFCWFYNGLKTRFQSLRDAFGSPTPVLNESASAHEIIDKSNAFKTSIMLRVQGLLVCPAPWVHMG